MLQPDLNLFFRITRSVERKPVTSSERREIGAKPKIKITGVWIR